MWKLKVAEGGRPWLRTLNNHVGRQVWELDPHSGSPQDLPDIETARRNFHDNRFTYKHSDDPLMRLQFVKENPAKEVLLKVTVKDDVTEEAVATTVRRALNFYSTIQSHDGHWPGDYGGPMFLMPALVIALSVTGALNEVLTDERREEMRCYRYNHQNKDGGRVLHVEGPSTMFILNGMLTVFNIFISKFV